MEFMEVIESRRSVRKFKSDPIPEDVLNNILRAGRFAPSGGHAENHYFGIIKNKKKKEKLAEVAGGQEWIATAPIIISYCTYVGYDLAQVSENNFPLIVNQTRFGKKLIKYLNDYPDRKEVNIFWNNANPLLPGQQIFLAAVNYGLNACWVGYLDIARASQILNLPEDIVCLYLMPVGYADEEPEKIERKPLEELVFYDGWESS